MADCYTMPLNLRLILLEQTASIRKIDWSGHIVDLTINLIGTAE